MCGNLQMCRLGIMVDVWWKNRIGDYGEGVEGRHQAGLHSV